MTHQDWKPVVWRKDPLKPQGPPALAPPKPKHANASVNMKRLDEDDSYAPPKMTRELGQQIIQGRSRLKLTQEQLAQKCSIPLGVVREYEKGMGVYNRIYLDPLCKLLGFSLPRPKQNKPSPST